MVADQQTINVLKDVVVPLVASAIGAGAALIAGYYAIVVPQREQQKLEDATARFEVAAFFEVTHLCASTILTGDPLGPLEEVLRERTVRFIDIIPKFAVRLDKVLTDEDGNDTFHLMMIELDRQRHFPSPTDHEVLFAYGAAATVGVLLGTSDRKKCVEILALLIKQKSDTELSDFFGVVVDRVLPLDAELEVHRQASA
jgi:hypothetical protein